MAITGLPSADGRTGRRAIDSLIRVRRSGASGTSHTAIAATAAGTTGRAGTAPAAIGSHTAIGALASLPAVRALADAHPGVLAEALAVRAMLTFAREVTPSAELAGLIRAAYDPAMPRVARDPSHALRLAARLPH